MKSKNNFFGIHYYHYNIIISNNSIVPQFGTSLLFLCIEGH